MVSDENACSEKEQFVAANSDSTHREDYETGERKSLFVNGNGYGAGAHTVHRGWTLNLILCCLCVTLASLQFGYNIASFNSPSAHIKDFIRNHTFLFNFYHQQKSLFENGEIWISGNRTLLADKMYEVEQIEAQYIECSWSGDVNCTEQILTRKRNTDAELLAKYNWTDG
jgi:hypothetical protein